MKPTQEVVEGIEKDQRKQSGDKLDDLNCATNVNVVRLSFRMDDSLQEWILSPDGASPERSVRIEKTSIQYKKSDHQSTENGSNQERDTIGSSPRDRLPDLVVLRELDCHEGGKHHADIACDRTHQREDDENPKNKQDQ